MKALLSAICVLFLGIKTEARAQTSANLFVELEGEMVRNVEVGDEVSLDVKIENNTYATYAPIKIFFILDSNVFEVVNGCKDETIPSFAKESSIIVPCTVKVLSESNYYGGFMRYETSAVDPAGFSVKESCTLVVIINIKDDTRRSSDTDDPESLSESDSNGEGDASSDQSDASSDSNQQTDTQGEKASEKSLPVYIIVSVVCFTLIVLVIGVFLLFAFLRKRSKKSEKIKSKSRE